MLAAIKFASAFLQQWKLLILIIKNLHAFLILHLKICVTQ